MSSPIETAKAVTPSWMMEIQTFDAIEVHPVCNVGQDGQTGTLYCEVCTPEEADFWSVYGHLKEGGVDCLEDFPTQEEAETFAARLRSAYPHLR